MSGFSRRDYLDDEKNELEKILELSRKTFEEETLKRSQKFSRSFGVETTRNKTGHNSNDAEQKTERRKSFTDDDLINLKSSDLATELKIKNVRAVIGRENSSSPSSLYYNRNISVSNQFPQSVSASAFPPLSLSTPKTNFAHKFRESASFSNFNTGIDANFIFNGSRKESTPISSGSSSTIIMRKTGNQINNTPALPIPYLPSFKKSTNYNNLINFAGSPSVAVRVSTKEDLMKEFDPLMSSEKSIESIDEEPIKEKIIEGKTFHKKLSLDSGLKSRPLTIVNRSTNVGGSRTGGFNVNNLKIIERISDPENQLNEIRSILFEDGRAVDDVWSRLIISPRVQYPVPAVSSVKLVVRCELLSAPIIFTCDVCSSIELTAAQVLFDVPPTSDSKSSKVSLDEFALKVFALDEYFLPSTQLCDYAYVHNCIKLGKDVELQLVKLPSFQSTFNSSFVDSMTEINRFSIKNKDISIALDTFKSELNKLEEAATIGNAAHSSGVVQSVKMICTFLHNVQPLDLVQNLNQLKNVCDSLVEDRKTRIFMQKQRGISNDDVFFRPSSELLQNLKRSISSVAFSVHRFLTTYSDSSYVSFTLPSLDESTSIVDEKISKEIVDIEENLLVRIESVHNFPSEWLTTYEKFYLACYVFHGLSETSEMIKTEPAIDQKTSSFKCLKFDYWMTFDKTLLCVLPRESRICFVLFGTRVEIESEGSNASPAGISAPSPVRSILEVQLCWGTLPLFDFRGRLNQSSYFVSMSKSPIIEPWGPQGLLADCNNDWPVLAVTLPSFSFNYRFPDVLVAGERTSRSFECLDLEQQQILEDIIEHGSILDADEKDILWEKRHYLIKKPEALPLVLKSAVGWDWACLSNIYQLLNIWTPLNTAQAVELLLPEFPDVEIRAKACSWLASSGADQLHDFLPQLTEALSFEVYENSPLAKLLLQISAKNRRFAYGLFWQLEERRTRNLFGCRCTMMQNFLISILGDDFYEAIDLQQKLVIQMDTVAVEIKQCKDSERMRLLSTHVTKMDGELLQKHVHLPLYPSVLAAGVEWTKCKYFASLTLPVKISFRTLNSTYDVLHKVGDDLRQDALVLQMIRLMDDLWLRDGLDLRMITYRCLSTGFKKGMIDMVHDCKTLREIHVEEGGVTGALNHDLIRKWLQKQNASELDYLSALENFRRSCAGWCVGTFILGIGDRHNDNIMITSKGHVFHIDFGKYLGDAQMFGNFKRDRTPFVLTNDMVTVINGGSSQGTYFQDFVDACCKSFNIVRNNYALFINLMKLMVCSNIPGLTMDAVKYICSNLWLDCTDNEASVRFTRMIEETIRNKFPTFNFVLHTTVALWKSPSNPTSAEEKYLLSFSPKIFTAADDGRLKSMNVLDCEKWRDNDKKVYMYKIQVERVNVKVPSYIYRSYKEFSEFSDCLYNRFPLAKIISLPHGRSIGRTNVRDIAERRRQEIDIFLQSLFRMTEEIAHSEIVYTFFHPLLRDEQRIEKSGQPKILTQQKSSYEIKGELKISVDYIKDHLEVMIHHARDLAFVNLNVPPDTYVKCYLRPDRERRSKRKTRIICKSVNPTYNETFVYRWPRESLIEKVLELTVWRKGTLKENAFLGCVRISLDQIFIQYPTNKIFESWFRLMNKLS